MIPGCVCPLVSLSLASADSTLPGCPVAHRSVLSRLLAQRISLRERNRSGVQGCGTCARADQRGASGDAALVMSGIASKARSLMISRGSRTKSSYRMASPCVDAAPTPLLHYTAQWRRCSPTAWRVHGWRDVVGAAAFKAKMFLFLLCALCRGTCCKHRCTLRDVSAVQFPSCSDARRWR